jgi:hypothetical protein
VNRAKVFSKGTPFILCGDFNSQPYSHVHQYLVKGAVNAKLVAPWYFSPSPDSDALITPMQDGIPSTDTKPGAPEEDTEPLASNMKGLFISNDNDNKTSSPPPPQVRYMLDFTLNRFCRWLRILGLDAALESEAEERLRTKEGKL